MPPISNLANEPKPILTIRAYQIADEIDIKRCRAEFLGDLAATAPGELFYRRLQTPLPDNVPASRGSLQEAPHSAHGYLYVMDYGVVIFAGYQEAETIPVMESLKTFCQGSLSVRLGEDIRVHADSAELVLDYNDIHLPSFGADVLRIIMLYVGQSAALDYYEAMVGRMMDETARYAKELERDGKLKTSRKNVQRFIGRILAVRNRIIDNLYIMDAPDITWESEYLDKVDRGMKKTFDIAERFRSLDYQLREIKENLELYAELLQFRQSNMLELIIIALIMVEVVNIFFH